MRTSGRHSVCAGFPVPLCLSRYPGHHYSTSYLWIIWLLQQCFVKHDYSYFSVPPFRRWKIFFPIPWIWADLVTCLDQVISHISCLPRTGLKMPWSFPSRFLRTLLTVGEEAQHETPCGERGPAVSSIPAFLEGWQQPVSPATSSRGPCWLQL